MGTIKPARTLKILRQKQINLSLIKVHFLPSGSAFFSLEDSYRMEPLQLNYLQASFTVPFEKIKTVLEEQKCPWVYSVYVYLMSKGPMSEASFTLCFWGLSCCLCQFSSPGFKESTSISITYCGQLVPVVCVVGSLWWGSTPPWAKTVQSVAMIR